MKNAFVIGATGDVGTGVTIALRGAGYRVTAIGRSMARLRKLRERLSAPDLPMIEGSIATEESARRLAQIAFSYGAPDLVLVSVNGDTLGKPFGELTEEDLCRVVKENVLPHFAAAKAFIPLIRTGGVFLGIGGGMADNIFPGMLSISVAQTAQRMLYRYLAKEPDYARVRVRELMLYSMIAGASKEGIAEPQWITDEEVGRHVVALLADLDAFEGPILALKSRKQVGQPERKPA